MLLSLVYAVVRLLLDVALLRCRSGTARDLELLALRHEVRVLRRRSRRIAWRPGDRLVLTALSRCFPRAGWRAFPVRPETLPRWHRELVRRKSALCGRRRGPGRPPLPPACGDGPAAGATSGSVANCSSWGMVSPRPRSERSYDGIGSRRRRGGPAYPGARFSALTLRARSLVTASRSRPFGCRLCPCCSSASSRPDGSSSPAARRTPPPPGLPSKPEPGLALGRRGTAARSPDPRPGCHVPGLLRRGVPGGGRAHRADTPRSTAGKGGRRALGGHGAPGLPRLAAHPRTPALGASLEGIRRVRTARSRYAHRWPAGSPPGQRLDWIRSSAEIGWEGSSTSTSRAPLDASTAPRGFMHPTRTRIAAPRARP